MDENTEETTTAEEKSDFLTMARGFLRVTVEDDIIDNEIKTLISACRQDLIRNGITSTMANSEEDSLIQMAIFLYLKAEFGLDNKNHEKYKTSYEQLKTELAITDDYITEKES